MAASLHVPLFHLAHLPPPSPPNAQKNHLQIHQHLHPPTHLRIHLIPRIDFLITPLRTILHHTTLHTVTIIHTIDLAGTILHLGILPGMTLLHPDEPIPLPTEKAVPEIHTVRQPMTTDIRIAIPTTIDGDSYIDEDAS